MLKKIKKKKFKVTKAMAKKIMAIDCTNGGITFKTDVEYITRRQGADGIKKIEKKFKELGYPFKFDEVELTKFYPSGYRILVFLIAKEVFGWTDEDIYDWGDNAPKLSLLFRLIIKYILTPEKALSFGPKHWKQHLGRSEMIVKPIDYKKREARVIIVDFPSHPVYCKYLSGYIRRFAQFSMPDKNVKVKKVKCKGLRHEFIITWD